MNANRIIAPSRNETRTAAENDDLTEPTLEAANTAAAITRLRPFERFVYVMSVLEKYSDCECSILLDCTVEEVVRARTRARLDLAAPAAF